MSFSAFDVIGPDMIGPSSSHTAGAVRIGLVARALAGGHPVAADVVLHGSFAETGKGHATDRALVAGLLGFATDDERLKGSLEIAEKTGLRVTFRAEDLGEEFHPNTARITVRDGAGGELRMTASSIGGGMIRVVGVDRYATDFSGELDAVIVWHHDWPGFLAKVTTLLACVEANIATIRTARKTRNTDALTVIEVDAPLPPDVLGVMNRINGVNRVVQLQRAEGLKN